MNGEDPEVCFPYRTTWMPRDESPAESVGRLIYDACPAEYEGLALQHISISLHSQSKSAFAPPERDYLDDVIDRVCPTGTHSGRGRGIWGDHKG